MEKTLIMLMRNILSMGMTNDCEVAIEEGATMVRVRNRSLRKRDYSPKTMDK